MPTDDVPLKMLALTLELLRAPEQLPPLAVGALWINVNACVNGRPAVALAAVEAGFFDLLVAQLRALGGAAEWLVRMP